MRLDLSNSRSWICYLHCFIEFVLKQNIIFDIFRHVELTNDIVWRIEGFRGWQFNRYKSIFILQLIRAVELKLFMMKLDRNLIFLAADNNQLWFGRKFLVYCCQMRKCFIGFSHLTHDSTVCTRYNFLNP